MNAMNLCVKTQPFSLEWCFMDCVQWTALLTILFFYFVSIACRLPLSDIQVKAI